MGDSTTVSDDGGFSPEHETNTELVITNKATAVVRYFRIRPPFQA